MNEINLAFVRPRKPTDRAQAYAQGHWMYEFIIERWGSGAPLEIMDHAAKGLSEEESFDRALGLGREAFLAEFRVWAGAQLEAVGLIPPPGLASLESLLDEMASRWAARDEPPTAIERLDALREMAREHSENPDVVEMLILAEVEHAGGEPTAELVPWLERYARLRPIDDLPHRLLARWYMAQQSSEAYFRAIDHLEFLDVRTTNSAVYAGELARLYFEAGDPDRAQRKAERATLIAPFDPGHREIAARIALVRKDYADAERHLDALARIEPDRERNTKLLEQVRRLRTGSGG
jgi:tetratricopeptide (TPR) repeat protein